ncbi:unnamed protein product [Vitrella brassicaformis CCMP3155]|uniref:EB1 C-terminal domain-containing protein n=2 Tax=Vitrella brassicaformis TaxID=1169539 RepID=A0A0G4GJQ3_VITBC|nr:unnamed protein product [Vitrella brassicaformis CCMP3155]|eukprot:CEM30115.1 unnamed protein product [Vitrella brassicaformis CCMP3155]
MAEAIGMMEGAFFVPRGELLRWVNNTFGLSLTKVEQCASGAVYIQIMDAILPGKVPMSKVNWMAKHEYEFVKNYKVLQAIFDKNNITKHIEVEKLTKGKYQDNLEMLQWMKAYFDRTAKGDIAYDPYERRRGMPVPDWVKTSDSGSGAGAGAGRKDSGVVPPARRIQKSNTVPDTKTPHTTTDNDTKDETDTLAKSSVASKAAPKAAISKRPPKAKPSDEHLGAGGAGGPGAGGGGVAVGVKAGAKKVDKDAGAGGGGGGAAAAINGDDLSALRKKVCGYEEMVREWEDERAAFVQERTAKDAMLEGLEKERDFYFGKLRDIEILCQTEGKTALDVQTIQEILYKTDDEEGDEGGEVLANGDSGNGSGNGSGSGSGGGDASNAQEQAQHAAMVNGDTKRPPMPQDSF